MKYLWAAFNARPFGMPIAPNWVGIAAFGLFGAFLSPGFWMLGAGLELAYLWSLAGSPRFRATVDASRLGAAPAEAAGESSEDARYRALMSQLGDAEAARHRQIEARAREILGRLRSSSLMSTHADTLEQLVWLHLRLLSARVAIGHVVDTARVEAAKLQQQEDSLRTRLEDSSLNVDLRRSLEQQVAVIDQRQAAHASAGERLEHVDAELARIDQQIALIREQSLLATDAEGVVHSLNALASSFDEANRWLERQRDLVGILDGPEPVRLPKRVLAGPPPVPGRGRNSVSQ
jgi:hypothetical protein